MELLQSCTKLSITKMYIFEITGQHNKAKNCVPKFWMWCIVQKLMSLWFLRKYFHRSLNANYNIDKKYSQQNKLRVKDDNLYMENIGTIFFHNLVYE